VEVVVVKSVIVAVVVLWVLEERGVSGWVLGHRAREGGVRLVLRDRGDGCDGAGHDGDVDVGAAVG